MSVRAYPTWWGKKSFKFRTLARAAMALFGMSGSKPPGAVSRTLWRRQLAIAVKESRRKLSGRPILPR